MTIDGDTSTSDTLPAVRHRRGRSARRAIASRTRRSARSRRSRAALHDLMRELAHPGRQGRRGPDASSSPSRSRAPRTTRRRGASALRSPTRRWSRRPSPARTPTGGASSWRSARPAKRPTATGCRSGSARIIVAEDGERAADLRRGDGRALHEGRARSSCASTSASARGRGHGVDLRSDPRLHLHQCRLSQLRG